ncbi:MAG: SDR family NAD(P)-dependent oxidoreductase [Rhizomicrobium sp.]|jgi:short-subunit dehydrogenase
MPTTFAAKYGPWAVVAGASEGLGEAFAAALAARGMNLLLLARRGDLLEDVARRLRADNAIEVREAVCDLARADLADALETLTKDLDVGLAVYNAAYGPVGEMVAQPVADLMRVVDVNMRAPLIVAHTFAPRMIARGRGGIVLMSSIAGQQGGPRIAAYAASKAFNTILGEGLWSELRPKGVDVVACCAGAIRTPAYTKTVKHDAPGTLEPRTVAEAALDALGRGPIVVPGAFNRFARFVLGRMLSRRVAIAAMGRTTKDFT